MKGSDCNKFLSSTYWGNLPKILIKNKTKTTWIHLFVKDKFIKDPEQASKLINKLNANNNEQNHLTLFSFININVSQAHLLPTLHEGGLPSPGASRCLPPNSHSLVT